MQAVTLTTPFAGQRAALARTPRSTSQGVAVAVKPRFAAICSASSSDKASISPEKKHAASEMSRRGLMASVLFAAAAPSFPAASQASSVPWDSVRSDIEKLVKGDPDKGPTLVRLAWHSSGTYDKMSKTGGSGQGTIRFKEELAHGGNAGLGDTAVAWLEPIHKKYAKAGLSYADLYTLGGVVAIKTLGGPDIPFRAGRVDAMDPSAVTPDGRLPDADKGKPGVDKADSDHIRAIFGRMGFNDQEMVALSGAHALGRCHANASGYVGPWTSTPTLFTNAYYSLLLKAQWTYDERYPNYQYKDASGTLMMLPTDLALVKDKEFVKWVEIYAKDSKRFNADFSAAFQKLEELGTSGLVEV